MSSIPAFLNRGGVDFSSPPSRKAVEAALTPPYEADVLDDTVTAASDYEAQNSVPPVYVGGARLIHWGYTARSGMTVEIMLRDVGPREVNPFKGLRYGKSQGQRFRTWVGPYSELIEIANLPEVTSVYSGESQLIHYGDTCNKGVTAKVLIDSGPDGVKGKHPFENMPIGAIEGMDLFVSFWAINDDETIIPKKAARRSERFHQMSEVKQSNTLVGDEQFVDFLHKRLSRLIGNVEPGIVLADNPRQWATEVVRLYLGVESRSVMNAETLDGVEARKRWKTLASEYFQSDEFHSRPYFSRR